VQFDPWSFVRDVLVRGAAVERSADAAGWGYERLSAALDKEARELADRLKPHLASQKKRFPIQDGPSIPWEYMAPHESQAQKNHGQTIARLAERGGLGAAEAELIVTAQPLSPKTGEWDWAELKRRWVERAERVNNAYLAKESA
jgi:hypothetical protein